MKTILLLTDFSEKAKRAAVYALHIAKSLNSNICLYHTFTPPDIGVPAKPLNYQIEEQIEQQTKSRLAALSKVVQEQYQSDDNGFVPEISVFCKAGEVSDLGKVVNEVISEKNIWLVIMGFKGEEPLSNFTPGSDTYSVIEHASCPVLLVPPSAKMQVAINRIAVLEESFSYSKRVVDYLACFQSAFNTSIMACTLPLEKGPVHYSKLQLEKQLNHSVEEVNEDELESLLQQPDDKPIDILAIKLSHKSNFRNLFYGPLSKILLCDTNLPLLVFTGNF